MISKNTFKFIFIYGTILNSILIFNSASLATPKSDWQNWLSQYNEGLKVFPDSFLSVIDDIPLNSGGKVFVSVGLPPGKSQWSKSESESELKSTVLFEYKDKEVFGSSSKEKNINLSKQKKWSLPDGRVVTLGRPHDDQIKILLHDPKAPALVEFKELKFFPFDEQSVVKGSFTKLKEFKKVQLLTSKNTYFELFEAGEVSFNYKGQPLKLKAYTPNEPKSLKILAFFFKDQTNGKESYGGGRNLEVELKSPTETEITLDFNRTFNPYCARSTHYQCILSSDKPLPVAITAGELKSH